VNNLKRNLTKYWKESGGFFNTKPRQNLRNGLVGMTTQLLLTGFSIGVMAVLYLIFYFSQKLVGLLPE
jgi:hypothetical protein